MPGSKCRAEVAIDSVEAFEMESCLRNDRLKTFSWPPLVAAPSQIDIETY